LESEIGLVGFGLSGKAFHAPVIQAVPGLRLAAILQRTGSFDSNQYPGVRLVRSLDELLAVESLRLIVIATPNTSHFALAQTCLEAGKDVVVEKPFATSFQEAERLVAVAERLGRMMTVFHERRWDGDFQTVKQIVDSGELGRVVRFEAYWDRFRPEVRIDAWREQPEPGSGVLFDLAPHLIDQTLILFGRPDAVTSDVRIERDGALTDDAFDLLLHYPRGVTASLHSSMLVAAPRPRYILHGTCGAFVKHGIDPQEALLRAGARPTGDAWGLEAIENWGRLTLSDRQNVSSRTVPTARGDYRCFYENLRDAFLGIAPLAISPSQALDVMRVLELARRSSARRATLSWAEL
jgi:scyllo-inositol 2-dehydrogenase (NADP+)